MEVVVYSAPLEEGAADRQKITLNLDEPRYAGALIRAADGDWVDVARWSDGRITLVVRSEFNTVLDISYAPDDPADDGTKGVLYIHRVKPGYCGSRTRTEG